MEYSYLKKFTNNNKIKYKKKTSVEESLVHFIWNVIHTELTIFVARRAPAIQTTQSAQGALSGLYRDNGHRTLLPAQYTFILPTRELQVCIKFSIVLLPTPIERILKDLWIWFCGSKSHIQLLEHWILIYYSRDYKGTFIFNSSTSLSYRIVLWR